MKLPIMSCSVYSISSESPNEAMQFGKSLAVTVSAAPMFRNGCTPWVCDCETKLCMRKCGSDVESKPHLDCPDQ